MMANTCTRCKSIWCEVADIIKYLVSGKVSLQIYIGFALVWACWRWDILLFT